MSGVRSKYDEEFKKNAVKLSYASPKTVRGSQHFFGQFAKQHLFEGYGSTV